MGAGCDNSLSTRTRTDRPHRLWIGPRRGAAIQVVQSGPLPLRRPPWLATNPLPVTALHMWLEAADIWASLVFFPR